MAAESQDLLKKNGRCGWRLQVGLEGWGQMVEGGGWGLPVLLQTWTHTLTDPLPHTYRALSIVESQSLVPSADPFLHVWDHVLQESQEIVFIAQLFKFAAFLVSAHNVSCHSNYETVMDAVLVWRKLPALLSHTDSSLSYGRPVLCQSQNKHDATTIYPAWITSWRLLNGPL